jgi:hypothetical protein
MVLGRWSTSMAALPALAMPGERGRITIPGGESGVELGFKLGDGAVVGAVIDPSVEDPEERFGQIQPRPVGGRVAELQASERGLMELEAESVACYTSRNSSRPRAAI